MNCAACGHVAHPDEACNTKACDCSAAQYTPEHAADAHVFGSPDGGTTDVKWDGSAGRFTDEQYQRAAAACDPGDGTVKERCFLPHHEPDGTTNVNGVHAAAQRISGLSGRSADAVSKAKAHLRSHYKALGEDPPDSIAESTQDPGKAASRRASLTQGSGRTLAAVKPAADAPPAADPVTGAPYRKWHMPVAVLEGVRTGDGRKIAPEALTWRDLPQPLMALTKTTEGHDQAEVVGRVDEAKRVDASKMIDARTGEPYGKGTYAIEMWGVFTNDAEAQKVHDLIAGRFLRGVSVDLSDVEAELEVVDKPDDEDSDGGLIDILFGGDDMLEVLTAGRIGPVTVVPFPAFEAAYIELIDAEGNVGPSTQPGRPTASEQRRALRIHHAFTSRPCVPCQAGKALVAGGGPQYPPADWFDDPHLEPGTGPLTVLDDGRLFGRLAEWETCHTGFTGQCVRAPHSQTGYALFRTGAVKTAEDALVAVGQIAIDTGHASIRDSRLAAMRHYDHTGTAVADVAVGEDAHGIWVAGAVRPDITEAQLRALRACALSGDWRDWGGNLELIAVLGVNTPGFPVLRQLVAAGMPQALTAALGPPRSEDVTPAAIVADAIAHLPELRLMRAKRVADARARVASARASSARARMAGR